MAIQHNWMNPKQSDNGKKSTSIFTQSITVAILYGFWSVPLFSTSGSPGCSVGKTWILSVSLLNILVSERRRVTGDLDDDCEPFGEQSWQPSPGNDNPSGLLGISMPIWGTFLPPEVPWSVSPFICFCRFGGLHSSPKLADCTCPELSWISEGIGPEIVIETCASILAESETTDSRLALVLQTGQVECERNHMSIHSTWKPCLQFGRSRAFSFSSNSHRQTAHSRPSMKSWALYTNMGRVCNIEESNPVFWRLAGTCPEKRSRRRLEADLRRFRRENLAECRQIHLA